MYDFRFESENTPGHNTTGTRELRSPISESQNMRVRTRKLRLESSTCVLSVVAFVIAAFLTGTELSAVEPDVSFNRDIRPILSAQCFACHGPDQESREADLRLDTAEGAFARINGSQVIAAGKPDQSELVRRIESVDPDEVMPPPDSGHQLSAEQKQLLRQWIESGARYDVHWSFVAPSKPHPPTVKNWEWPRHAIDNFVLSRLESAKLIPNQDADRLQWIRRVSLDLTGLPPTPEQADAFAKDMSHDAYEKVVDRLLKSNDFGEHWARMWLDLARYADTRGYEKDRPRQIWRYRDWVIDALNRDMPFDQFTTEQLAGDLLADPTNEQLLATAFHRNTMTNEEGGTDDEEFRIAAVKDRVDTTMQVWMGLTMGCAKCHSHKFDPISQHDYYSFMAFFNQSQDADRGDEAPVVPTPTRDQQRRLSQLEANIADAKKTLGQSNPAVNKAFAKWRNSLGDQPIWSPLKLTGFQSAKGVEAEQNEEHIVVASGDVPQKDTYTITFEVTSDSPLTALRIETLPNSMGGGWDDRNFVLSELTVASLDNKGGKTTLPLKTAQADFSQSNWAAASSIDGKPRSGWAVSPQIAQQHSAVFTFAKPVNVPTGTRLVLTLSQQYGQQHVIGRLRVSTSTIASRFLTGDLDVEAGLRKRFAEFEFPQTKQLHAQITKLQNDLKRIRSEIPSTPIMRDRPDSQRRKTHIHLRGNFLSHGEQVEPQIVKLFGELPEDEAKNRLAVARWIVSDQNPLTARVMVNRVWARLFGIGLVETEEDFGSQGTPPSHPQMLDWLAVDFRSNGWSLKSLLRSIVLSATYRQASGVTQAKLEADPLNRLMSRGPRFRLPAETVRDQALAASGLLTRKIGGPSVMPPQPEGVWKSTYSALKWTDATGPDRYRRALYTYWKRTSPYPAMTTFDAGSGEVCQIRRVRTNTPLQALVMLNDPAYVEAAGALSKQMEAVDGTVEEKIRRGFRLVLIRHPEQPELDRLEDLYRQMSDEYANDTESANELLKSARRETGDAALVTVANVLLNLDETMTRP